MSNKKYPENAKEGLVLGVFNCLVMVSFMMNLNLWFAGVLSLHSFFSKFLFVFAGVFMLDLIFVGPLSKKIAIRFNAYKYMLFYRAAMMAGILTFFVPLLSSGYVLTQEQYLINVVRNYICAMGIQAFIAMPFALFILSKYRALKNINLK